MKSGAYRDTNFRDTMAVAYLPAGADGGPLSQVLTRDFAPPVVLIGRHLLAEDRLVARLDDDVWIDDESGESFPFVDVYGVDFDEGVSRPVACEFKSRSGAVLSRSVREFIGIQGDWFADLPVRYDLPSDEWVAIDTDSGRAPAQAFASLSLSPTRERHT